MIVHDTQPYMTRIGGQWQTVVENDKDGNPFEHVILAGGVDKWVCPPSEHHEDTCPCVRCEAHRYGLQFTKDDVANTEVQEEYKDPELTPEDLARLRGENPGNSTT